MSKICKCGVLFTPQIGFNGIALSNLCPDCRFSAEISKRLARKNSSLNRLKTAKEKVYKKTSLSTKTIPQLIAIAQKHFNAYIRNRDKLENEMFYCPTCKTTKRISGGNYHACHLFPAGHYPALRFDERNVWGGCQSCNYFKHGAGYEFSDYVRKKIGEEQYQKLIELKDFWKRNSYKWDRFTLIEIIEKYKKT